MQSITLGKKNNLKIAVSSCLLSVLGGLIWAGLIYLGRKAEIELFKNYVIVTVILECIILFIQYFVIKYNKRKFSLDFIDVKFKENSFKQVVIGLSISLLMYLSIISFFIFYGAAKFEGIGFMFYPANKVILSIISAFITSIFAGICEEIFCRGVMLNYLMKYKGKFFALIVSSLIFCLFHIGRYQNLISLTDIFLMGIVFGYLYIITKSLYAPIALHFLYDFCLGITGSTTYSNNTFLIFNIKNHISFVSKYFAYTQIIASIIVILILILKDKKNISIKA